MAEHFLHFPEHDRNEILNIASSETGRPAHVLEKDIWVVWALQVLFSSSLGPHLVFKGGTSLSKAYDLMKRFSEDVDLVYDIRQFISAPSSTAGDLIPDSPAQARKWSEEISGLLQQSIVENIKPVIDNEIAGKSLPAVTRNDNGKIYIDYDNITDGHEYVSPSVMLEFGARSTGEPAGVRPIACDAANGVRGVIFPTATPRVMFAERTFWEKATAIHVFCLQEKLEGDRSARHWYDLVRLANANIAATALKDHALAGMVAHHKSMFYPEKSASGEPIDYLAAVQGRLKLVPNTACLISLREDYQSMIDGGLLEKEAESFDAIIAKCRQIESEANNEI
jgi:hypothetical protein